MAFDGLAVAAVVNELNSVLTGGRISKIAQPEKDELLITVKNNSNQYRLFVSADASLPLIYLTETNKQAPLTAPGFCMLLRKYLQNAKIMSIKQPGLERIVRIELEHLNELGDICTKYLVCEIMGKHSNIILTDAEDKIIDSIKHVSGMVSSVRQVLPGHDYFVPNTQEKKNPLLEIEDEFLNISIAKNINVVKAVYQEYTGISPMIASYICENAMVDTIKDAGSLTDKEVHMLWMSFFECMNKVKQCNFSPVIYYKNGMPDDFSVIEVNGYSDVKKYESISELLYNFYAEKNAIVRIRQRSSDIRKIVQNAIERTARKLDLQLKQLKDTEDREKYKVYGELLTAYGYAIEKGAKKAEVLNYYNNENVTIALDENLSSQANAQKYYEKYNKKKRTFEALTKFTEDTRQELDHLESIMNSLDIALKEADLVPIKEELISCGYIKRKGNTKQPKVTTKPFHYVSEDGFHFYVGKNNFQNDELTFKFANGEDWWFHAKKVPGSHVVVKGDTRELPDKVYEQAGALAAYYSKGRDQDKVEVDYTVRKNVKKPAGAAPGFVVYYTNYSLIAVPSLAGLTELV